MDSVKEMVYSDARLVTTGSDLSHSALPATQGVDAIVEFKRQLGIYYLQCCAILRKSIEQTPYQPLNPKIPPRTSGSDRGAGTFEQW